MNQLKIIHPEKLNGWMTKGGRIWKIEYQGRDLSIGVDNYLWEISVMGVSGSTPLSGSLNNPIIDISQTIHLQINREIYSPQRDGIRDRNGIPTKIPPIKGAGLPINEEGVIDMWIQSEGNWVKWTRSPKILKSMDRVKEIIEGFIPQ
jgi:hypothetical protein